MVLLLGEVLDSSSVSCLRSNIGTSLLKTILYFCIVSNDSVSKSVQVHVLIRNTIFIYSCAVLGDTV